MIISKKKADALSNGLFLIGLAILLSTQTIWPGIFLLLWLTFAIREYFAQRFYDLVVTSILFLGLFLIAFFNFNAILAPVLLIVGGIYMIFREYSIAEGVEEEDPIEETEKEIKDGSDNP